MGLSAVISGKIHFLSNLKQKIALARKNMPDLVDLKGQYTARHVLEIVAAGGHHLLIIGPFCAGNLTKGGFIQKRLFREPYHLA